MTDDPRIGAGMKRQLASRRSLLKEGARHVGWKVGFGAPAAQERLSLEGPLVGFLTDRTALRAGDTVDIAGWQRPVAEPEIAIHIGRDVPPHAPDEQVRRSIGALGPALELADVYPEPVDVEEILAGDIYHRGYVLGAPDTGRAGGLLEGLEAVVEEDGRRLASTTELESLTGAIVDIVGHVATYLHEAGESLQAGDVLIAGSVVPPIAIVAGQRIVYRLGLSEPLTVVID